MGHVVTLTAPALLHTHTHADSSVDIVADVPAVLGACSGENMTISDPGTVRPSTWFSRRHRLEKSVVAAAAAAAAAGGGSGGGGWGRESVDVGVAVVVI